MDGVWLLVGAVLVTGAAGAAYGARQARRQLTLIRQRGAALARLGPEWRAVVDALGDRGGRRR